MPDILRIVIHPVDFQDSTGYSQYYLHLDHRSPLRLALQRAYGPAAEVSVGAHIATIGPWRKPDQVFQVPYEIWGGPHAEYSASRITDLCRRARETLEGIPMVILSLKDLTPAKAPVIDLRAGISAVQLEWGRIALRMEEKDKEGP